MDLEYTTGCKSDYFLLETTGEKICGHLSQPETRTINFFGHSRDLRLIFNSDRQLTAPGFEVRIEQIPNSCDDLSARAQNISLASMVAISTINNPQPIVRSARILQNPEAQSFSSGVTQSPLAQALSFTNNR